MGLVALIIGILLTLAFLAAGIMKLISHEQMVQQIDQHLGVSPGLRKTIGALEVAAAVGIALSLIVAALEWVGIAAAVGLVLLMIGAVIYHVRANDPPQAWAPPAVLGVLALVFTLFMPA